MRALALAVFMLTPILPLQAAAPDPAVEIPRLLDGLDAKVKALREQAAKNPDLGLGKVADDLEARAGALRKTSYAKGWNLLGDDSAYVSMGNKIYVTDNFFGSLYSDEDRQAILLHEAVHLDQGLWGRKLKFWGESAEIPAYQDEYKWLTVLGVGKETNRFEVLNALQALREYKVIVSDDKTEDLEKKLGLTPELIKFFGPKAAEPLGPAQNYENAFYSFRLPGGWKVDYAGDEARKRYVFMTREVEKVGGAGITVTLGVRMTIGEIIGADYAGPSLDKIRSGEMADAAKWNFGGGKVDVVAKDWTIAGEAAPGLRKTDTKTNSDQSKQVMVTDKMFLKKGRLYYYVELFYDQKHAKPLEAGFSMLQQSLTFK